MRFQSPPLWFGSEEGYDQLVMAQARLDALASQGPEALNAAIQARGGLVNSEGRYELPPIWSLHDGVAVLQISGSLVVGSSGYGRLYDVLGYDDIIQAAHQIKADDAVKAVLLFVDSGGGMVRGLEDAGAVLDQLAEAKPMITFTDGAMASAAYWLGLSGSKLYGSRTSESGSIGTLIVHVDRSKEMEQMGRKYTLVRSGEFKALASQFETLEGKHLTYLQGKADAMGKIFVEFAATRRGTTPEKFQETMGEGRVFAGDDALKVGLLDGVMSFQEMRDFMKTLDKSKTVPHNPRNPKKDIKMKFGILSKSIILAIFGGAAVKDLDLTAQTANAEGVTLDATALAAAQVEATEYETAAKAALDKRTETMKADHVKALGTVEASLAESKTKIEVLNAATTALTQKVAVAETLAADYAPVVKASISVMSVALGGAADTAAALVGPELVAEHTRVAEAYKAKFKVGGVAAVTGLPKDDPKGADVPLAFLANLKTFKQTA